MPETMTTTKTASIADASFVQRFTDSGNSIEQTSPSIPVAKVGTLTTRTDDDTGTFTMVTGHGFATSDKIDVFWAAGSRRNMTATVTGDSVVLDGGSGTVLPIATTAITAMKPVAVVFVVDGTVAKGLAVYSPVAGYIVFFDSAGTPAAITAATYTLAAGDGKSWSYSSGETNPLGVITTTTVRFSHGDSTAAREMKARVIFN